MTTKREALRLAIQAIESGQKDEDERGVIYRQTFGAGFLTMLKAAATEADQTAEELVRLRRRECKLCVEYDFDEHDPSCCPHTYGCCGKACPNCNNKGTPRG